jgi:asparagine synthase (glutamine-hydrolysing)
MCGIAGAVWNSALHTIDQPTLDRMVDCLVHRGPDDRGLWETAAGTELESSPWRVALGHRRLSIIDLTGGHQPLCNEDGTIWISFNGEIYNFRELRRRLEGAGHRFRSRSDTEVIVHLYEDLGTDCFAQLNGMFALAIWDGRRRQLVLARDRFGKKPLVYRHDPGRLLFASQLKSLWQVPGLPREIDPQALDEYLTYQYVPHPRTIVSGYCKLPPASWAVYRDDQLEIGSYWHPDFNRQSQLAPLAARSQLRALLESSVALRLESDVPLGAFLSGGIDSSIIVGLMQRAVGQRVKTFSIGFPVPEYDETNYARMVADKLGTDHHEFRVEPDAVEILDELVWHYDEPLGDSSSIPTYYVSKLAREFVTVVLTGDGGDELFAGYSRYLATYLAGQFDRLPTPLQKLISAPLWQRLPASGRQRSALRRVKRLLAELPLSPQQRYLQWIAIFGESRRAALYNDDFLARLPNHDPVQFLRDAFARSDRRDAVTATSLADLVTYLPCDLMTKVDVASMAHSLECRQPFLDYRLAEWAAALPVSYKFRRGRGKCILRETFAEILPPAVRRRPKMGFGVPLDHWFRHELKPLVHDLLLSPSAQSLQWFRPEALAELVQEHEAGRFDHSARLWTLLFLELWARRWLTDSPAMIRSQPDHSIRST